MERISEQRSHPRTAGISGIIRDKTERRVAVVSGHLGFSVIYHYLK
jgi:hypothetical protein